MPVTGRSGKPTAGRGVAFCPHCDGPFYKGKPAVVVGGGNSGVYAAGDLTTVPYKQIIITMGEGVKAGLSTFEDFARGNVASLTR